MPIGILDDNEFEQEMGRLRRHSEDRVSSTESHPNVEIIDKPRAGRKDGDVNVPDSLRAIIGETAVIDGRRSALSLAADFGISASSVSAYTKGATSTSSYESPSKSIISHINKSRERAVKRASKTLNGALSAITQEKLDYSDAKDLSGIAKDMSVIIKNLEPDKQVSEQVSSSTPQFVIFAPQFRSESSFEVIDVKE